MASPYDNYRMMGAYGSDSGRTRNMGIPYPRDPKEGERLAEQLDDALTRVRSLEMSSMCCGPVERIVYKDSAPAKVPTNKKLILTQNK